jgi:Fe-S-cluster containining protein
MKNRQIKETGAKFTKRIRKPKQPDRACGTCQACCGPVFIIENLKRADEDCQFKAPKGCGVYENRPQVCKDFRCLWHYGVMRGEQRPDRIGIIVTLTEPNAPYLPPGVEQALIIREVWPGASTKGEGSWYIQEMARTNIVIVIDGGSRRLLGPQHLVHHVQARLLTSGLAAKGG